ncbi:MAG: YbjN domain-containing protein [Myxococcota bacterium]
MHAGFITPQDVSTDLLAALYEDAGMETERDPDGDLLVCGHLRFLALPQPAGGYVHLLAFARPSGRFDAEHLAGFVNAWNDRYAMVRAALGRKGELVFDHCLWIEGGTTAANVLAATRAFEHILVQGLGEASSAGVVAPLST